MDYYYYNMYSNYYSSYYNTMYGTGYDPYDYYSYYMYQEMMNGSTSTEDAVETTTITTEIQSYTPLYFEIYIEE